MLLINMCDKAILNVTDCYKNQEMCNKAVDNYPHALEFVSECYMTQKMCDKAVSTYPSTMKIVPEYFKNCVINQLIDAFLYLILFLINIKFSKCNSIISEDPFSIRYVCDQYKTPQMCDKALDDCLAALKFVPDWFVTSKIIEKLSTALYAD